MVSVLLSTNFEPLRFGQQVEKRDLVLNQSTYPPPKHISIEALEKHLVKILVGLNLDVSHHKYPGN